ncbi:NYN domain-containing protein [Variovorax sp. J22R133]|uniref:NYN domain-containing protein n=1 Tax=Variovorax brevis TaxID=3053503 RepID=UPI0025763713|nr:NYN domain-containing protein [Variovorax sp. J22R133]MDM0114613.1 NYN domain-containing protein [Variovorax sp. J22R133]
MNNDMRVMLLIDADNVSADVIEQAVHKVLGEHGHLHVRRAYCNAETALKQQSLFKRLGVRPMVNLAAGKNSTDIALAVDAMDLAVAERPDVVYLVSSDSDFAPLVIRLREKGCRVCGIGQQGKTGDETTTVYDQFTDLQHHASSQPADKPTAKSAAKRAPRASRAKAKPAAPPPPPKAPMLPDEVVRILEVVPEFRTGEKIELNQAVEWLRAGKLLSKSASSLKLFRKHPDWFDLSPSAKPSKVQYIGPDLS